MARTYPALNPRLTVLVHLRTDAKPTVCRLCTVRSIGRQRKVFRDDACKVQRRQQLGKNSFYGCSWHVNNVWSRCKSQARRTCMCPSIIWRTCDHDIDVSTGCFASAKQMSGCIQLHKIICDRPAIAPHDLYEQLRIQSKS